MFQTDDGKKERVLKTAEYFLKNGGSLIDVSQATGFSKSSVQRYLNDQIIIEELGEDTYLNIKNQLTSQKYEGKVKGGQNYATNNIPIKDEYGKFGGSKSK